MTKQKIKYALISVYDKTDINIIAKALIETGYLIIATAGTGAKLESVGIDFILAPDMTGNPKALEDCLQTLSFKFAGGIVFDRDNKIHLKEVRRENIPCIDIVVCNITNIVDTVKTQDDFNIHNVDLGGPTMIRAACINFRDVLIVTDPKDYTLISKKLRSGQLDISFRKIMAIKGLSYTSDYDKILTNYLIKSSRI